MKKHLRDFFIPHEGNEYRPHSLREESVFYLGTTLTLLFVGAILNSYVLLKTDFFAAIVPSVLADYANEERKQASLWGLEWSPILALAAEEKARDMTENGYFAHTSPGGIPPWYWFKKAGYNYRYAGENLAVYFSDSDEVHSAWMNSPGHRANILNGKFSEIGIAVVKGMYQGNETVFVVELFGRPKESPVVVNQNTPIVSPEATPTSTVLSGTAENQDSIEKPVSAGIKQENELFIAVEDASGNGEGERIQKNVSVPEYSTVAERTFASPRSNLYLSYLIFFAIIAFALFIGVAVEFRRHHPLHTIYGVSLLVFLCALYVGAEVFIFSNVSII